MRQILLILLLQLSIYNWGYAQLPPPVAHYPFSGNADDDSGNGNHGILGGETNEPVLTTDRFGNVNSAYRFGGFYNKNWIRVPNSPSLNFNKQMSISFWFRQCSFAGMDGWGHYTPNGYHIIWSKAGDGIAANPGLWSGTSTDAESTLHINFNNTNVTGNPNQTSTNFLGDTTFTCFDTCEWVHVVEVIDSNMWRMYIDGTLRKEKTIKVADFSQANTRDLLIGRMWGSSVIWYPFNGDIDDIYIFKQALSIKDVKELFGDYVDPLNTGIIASSDTICSGTSVTLTAYGGNQYIWTADPSLDNTTGSVVTASPQVSTTYFVQVTTAEGCTGVAEKRIVVKNCNSEQDTCLTNKIYFNTGRNPITGQLIPIGQQDPFWKITSVEHGDIPLGISIPYNPYIISKEQTWWSPINSRWVSYNNSYIGNPGVLVEITKHFITSATGLYKLKALFSVDDYVKYFKIDGENYFTSYDSLAATNYTNQNISINDSIIFLEAGCHDITCLFGNAQGVKNATGINIEGYIESLSGDSTLLREACYETNPIKLMGDNTINYCSDCQFVSPKLELISAASCSNLQTAKVYFISGYMDGEDTLKFAPFGGITSSFNTATGVLTLTGNANYSVWQDVLRTVCYQSLVDNNSNKNKNIVISLGDALYNPDNGHYYKLVKNENRISWTDARDASAISTYFGLQGYLVTITSEKENNFLTSLINSNTWIGASDVATEGVWRWVTGCEGLEEDGKGRHFSDQQGTCGAITGTGISYGGNYQNWRQNEPNDFACEEDFAFLVYEENTNDSFWNDDPNFGATPVYNYIIEYGCMPGDPEVHIQGSITIHVGSPDEYIIDARICKGQRFTLPDGSQVSTSGIYIDTLTSTGGCDSIVHINLTVLDGSDHFVDFTISALPTGTLPIGSDVTLSITNPVTNGNYEWFLNGESLGQHGAVFTTKIASENNVFSVKLISGIGDICGGEGKITITGILPTFKMPNAFTPNGDGKNDVFRAVIDEGVEILELTIVSRWGQTMYSASGNQGWNGKFNGKDAPSDTYIYQIKYRLTPTSEVQSDKGTVTLIR